MEQDVMLQSIFAEANIGIIIVNEQGKIIKANPFVEKLFGYEPNELIDVQLEELLPQSLRAKHVAYRKNYQENPMPRVMGSNLELFGQKKDDSQFHVEISLSYTKFEGQVYAIAYISDNTKPKELWNELKENKKRLLEYSTHLEERVQERTKELRVSELQLKKALENEKELGVLKSKFVSLASHEFRTPLTAILSSANLVEKYKKEEQQDKREKHLNRISNSVKHLTTLLNDFLSLEKIETGKISCHPVELDWNEFMMNLTEEMQTIGKENQKIIYKHLGEKQVTVDESLLKNILINLISNGLKYSDVGACVEVSSKNQNGTLSIEVKDEGIGIPVEEQKHLFTQFFRAKNVEGIQGTGLGLTIVKRYLNLMNGNIRFVSEQGKGSTFFIEIPLST